ncbi:hypothetical protein [Streptomyces sp. NPDC057910]|uniref:hypothetical protein n=1 Tax=Streptomyces sp. NPDC057910 TaxID=3346278 RepID=UPI0036DFE6DF
MDVTPEQIDAWGGELAGLTEGLAHLFARPEPAEVFAGLVGGLLDGLPKKNGWTMSARAGHAGPERIQKFLNAASWDDAALVGAVRDYALMLADALAAGVPFRWFAAGSGYGRDPHLRACLHAATIRYVLGIPVGLPLSGVAGKPDPGAPPAARAGDLP